MSRGTETRPSVFGLAAVFAGVLAWTLRPIWDDDIFMHVALGRELSAHGVLGRDVFSAATPAAPWVPFQLGYELVVSWLEHTFGLYGANATHALVIALAATLLFALLRREVPSRAGRTLLFVLFLFAFDERVRARPHVFNLLFECAFLLPLALGRWVPARPRDVLACFALGGIWGFFHSMGALWLCAVLGTFWVASPELQVRRHALYATFAAFAGVFATPSNLLGMQHVMRIQDQWKDFVPELGTSFQFVLAFGAPYGLVLTLLPLLACVAVAIAVRTNDSPARQPTLLSAAGMAFASVWLSRLCYYSVFALLLVWPELARFAAERLGEARRARLPRLAAVASLALALLLFAHVTPRYFFFRIWPWTTTVQPGAFPRQEVDALVHAGIGGALFNETSWGGYLLYRMYPGARTISDGRITFSREVAEILHNAQRYDYGVLAEVAYRRYGIDLVIARHGRMAPSPTWQLLLEGPMAQVWSRTGPKLETRRRALAHAGVPQQLRANPARR